MQISIFCQTFRRLAHIAETVGADDVRQYMKSVYIERRDGHIFAVATNARFAAVEYLGAQEGVDGSVNVSIMPELLMQAEMETVWNGHFTIATDDAHQTAQLVSSYGYVCMYDVAVKPALNQENHMANWRAWLPKDTPVKSSGAMYFNTDEMLALVKTAPSGTVVFPTAIDAKKPVVLRDPTESSWVGVFIPYPADKTPLEPATIPVWVTM